MASTTFVDYVTPITASWLNDVNNAVYVIIPGLGRFVVVATVAALRAVSKVANQSAMVVAYATLGDGGGGFYSLNASDSTSADNGGTIIVAADGGRWYLQQITTLSANQWGILPSVADNSPQLNTALSTNGLGNTIHIPTGNYPFLETLQITTSGHYYGDGYYASLQPATGFSGNNIHFAPNPALAVTIPVFEKFTLGNPNTGIRNGTSGLYIDTNTTNSFVDKFTLRDTIIFGNATSGNAVLAINTPSTNTNGGLYAANFENNVLQGGISLQATGDSNTIHKNVLSGNNIGIYASNVSGASLLTIVDNNITNTNGQIQIDAGSRFKILRNNMEQQVPFSNGGIYMVNISGANGTMSTPEIRGNHFGMFSGVTNAANLHLNNTQGALVSENTFLNANAAAVAMIIDSDCVNTRVGPNTYGSSVSVKVIDNGIGTMGVIKSAPLQGAWLAVSASAPGFYKDILGTVHMTGSVTAGSGTIFVLPAGFIPSQTTRFSVYSNNGSNQVLASIFVDGLGNVVMESGSNFVLSLDGINFPAVGLADTISNL